MKGKPGSAKTLRFPAFFTEKDKEQSVLNGFDAQEKRLKMI